MAGLRARGVLGVLGATVLLAGLTACASGGTAGSGSTSASGSPSAASTGASVSVSASGSASGSASVSQSGRTTRSELDGRSFVSTQVTGGHTLVPGSTITIAFEGGSLSANAGCNTMAGRYTLAGGKLTAPQLASTMMACDQALMDQDTWLAQFLASGPAYTLAGDTLTLTGATDTVVLGPAPSGADTLRSTGWKVSDTITITNQANTTAAVDPSLTAWMRFSGDEVAFNDSCNGGGGPAQIGDDTITFGALRQTLRACAGPSDALEQFMTQVLQGETTYSLSTAHGITYLQIMSTDGSKGLGLLADDTVGPDAFASGSATATSTSG
ncbi:META domain-containing protein [Nakamurella sp.]|uniref:META domain-containing protein n=1 Tax=Nakamurella sp. TaxID=1869182 RepID=UPI003B3B7159